MIGAALKVETQNGQGLAQIYSAASLSVRRNSRCHVRPPITSYLAAVRKRQMLCRRV
jgi:hypothetical protein